MVATPCFAIPVERLLARETEAGMARSITVYVTMLSSVMELELSITQRWIASQ
jgi:hypothetical protein